MMQHPSDKQKASIRGVTLIELVLVVMVIGILLAIILPRAQRASVDAKYAGVRQAAVEIGRWGMDWAVRTLESQSVDATCTLDAYLATLVGYVGDATGTNWVAVSDALTAAGQCRAGTDGIPHAVAEMLPSESQPRNPFNGLSYFNTEGGNDGSRPEAGLLYLAVTSGDDGARHYYFVYTGTDSATADDWYAGMGQGTDLDLAQLRNGIFMARQVVP